MSSEGKVLTTHEGTVQQIYDRKIEQSGEFTAQSTAEEVASALATNIAGKTGRLHGMANTSVCSGNNC